MGFFSKFEGKMEDTFEGAAGKMQKSPISPVQIMKKAEKQMRREKVVSAGKQYAPTLYTVLVNPDDDQRLFGFYPTLAGECETRLAATASADGLAMDGHPLVRFIVDDGLKHGKFDIIAEVVSAPIVEQLRAEEMQRYGMGGAKPAPVPQAAAYGNPAYAQQRPAQPVQIPPVQQGRPAGSFAPSAGADYGQQIFGEGVPAGQAVPQPAQPQPAAKPPLPYVPEDEIDYSLNYGEYTFDSKNFEDYRKAEEQNQAENEDSHNGASKDGDFETPLPAAPEAVQAKSAPEPDTANASQEQAAHQPEPLRPERVAQQPEYPAQQYGYAPQDIGAYPVPNPAYPQMGMQPGNAYAYAQQQAQPYGAYPAQQGAYPNMQQSAPAPGAAYGAAPHTVAFAAGAAQANAVPHAGVVRAHLIDIVSNRSYDLATNRVLIGRETSNDIILNDLNVSRQHAQIAFEPQGVWVVTDLGSTNGTLVNGMPVTRRGLADGDRITLGMTEFVFSMR